MNDIVKVRYVGPIVELRGETALVARVDDTSVWVQFDRLELTFWAHGQHELPRSDVEFI